jgi:hypothetical protein
MFALLCTDATNPRSFVHTTSDIDNARDGNPSVLLPRKWNAWHRRLTPHHRTHLRTAYTDTVPAAPDRCTRVTALVSEAHGTGGRIVVVC